MKKVVGGDGQVAGGKEVGTSLIPETEIAGQRNKEEYYSRKHKSFFE